MKKRVIALLCVLAMLAGVLAGCGGKKETPTIKTPAITSITPGASSSGSGSDQATAEQSSGSFLDQPPPEQPTESTYTVYVKAYPGWGTVRLWAWSGIGEGDLFDAWPGGTMNLGSDGWYYMTISTKYDYVAINGLDGNIQTEDEYTGGKDVWILIEEDGYYVESSKPSDASVSSGTSQDGYIAELDGSWESVTLRDGSLSLNVSAKAFSQTVYNCTQMTISMQVEMNAGTSCKDWQIWGRSGSSFVKLGTIYLAAGNGYTSQDVTFSSPVTFDAIAITPTIPGGYSWSLNFIVTDVFTK